MIFSEKRLPKYAGSWYESDPAVLNKQLDAFLEEAAVDPKLKENILAVIAPHAGFRFSGSVAACSYKLFQNKTIERIFLLGPSHHVGFHGAVLPTASIFSTPLAELEVDQEAIKAFEQYDLFTYSERVHEIEHSLELHLPFVAKVLTKSKIVPIIVGQLSGEKEVHSIASSIRKNLRPNDVIIVSSDFTHYGPRYDYIPFGKMSKDKIKEMDMTAFKLLSRGDLSGLLAFRNKMEATICGINPCAVLCSLMPEAAKASLIKYATSADVYEDEDDNLVSYMSIVFNGNGWQ